MGSSRFARRYSGNRILLSCPPGTEIFHFPGLASRPYGFRTRCASITWHGFPHSGISGFTPVSGFPELIAAYYALRRLRAPRHPPYALPRLTIILPANVLFSYSVVKEQLSSNKQFISDLGILRTLFSMLLGGEYRARTGDLRLARAALSQLS